MNQVDRRLAAHSTHSESPEKSEDDKPFGRGTVWTFNLIVIAVVFGIMYELFPHFTHVVVFDGVLRNGWYFVPLAVIGYQALRYYRRNKVTMYDIGEHRRPLAVGATALVVTALWSLGVYATTDYFTFKLYANTFVPRDGLVRSAAPFVRFTPLENACRDIANSISTTGEEVECKYVAPFITKDGFGYAASISPHGFLNTVFQKNPGYMVLDDSASVSADPAKRLRRIDDVQEYGQGMEWFDNLDYVLAKTDFFASYDTPHLLALDDSKPDKLTLVVPKVKYGYLWRLPYWGGDVLVHADGTIEDLDAKAASADPRLKGKWIFPLSLARHYIEVQNYGLGWGMITPYVKVAGKLEVEKLSGSNQFPFVTRGDDGKTYLVTATRGQGSARGLYRIYYADATTGLGSFHQFGNHEVVYGAGASQERLTNIPGYQWHHKGENGGGTIIAIEPVYVVRANDPTLYWKYTITNVNYSGISATAVTNSSKPDEIQVFRDRSLYEAWLEGADVGDRPGANTGKGGDIKIELLSTIEKISKELTTLRQRVESLPAH